LLSGFLAVFGSLLVLSGWILGLSTLKSIFPGSPKMSPVTAMGFLLGGCSLCCIVLANGKNYLLRASQICAVVVVSFGLLKLCDYIFGWNLNFDLLGFHESQPVSSSTRMSPATALDFLLLGCALLLAGGNRLIGIFQILVLPAVLIGWMGFSRYLFGGEMPLPFAKMAIHTALLFIILSAGVFCTRTDGGLMALLVSGSAGGLAARRLFPSVLFVVFALNWFESWLDRNSWFSQGAKSALFTLNDIVVFSALVWFNAALLHRADMKRGRAEESRAQLADIVESSDDAIIGKTLDGVITSWNRGAEKIFGYSAKEAIGQPMLMLFPPERVNEERDILTHIALDENVENFETVRIRKDKKQIHISATISPVKDSSGKIVGASKIAHDITARRKLEEQFRQSQKMEGIGQLAGGVAHDFNNILAIIEMQSGLLKGSGGLSAEQSEFADEISITVQRAAALTRQLLLFSRREVFQPRDMDLNESVANTTKMLKRILGENVQIQIKLSSQPMFIHADASMMDQILLNLVVNARDAMPNGGQLIIETSGVEFDEFAVTQSPQARVGSFVRLNVSDSGCGIPPEILPKIFEPFFTTKDVGKGTGLGLATVFGIVQQHQGWINVYSEVNHGTTFRVYLPRLGKNGSAKTSPSVLTTTSGGNETILLVEDDPSLRASVRKALSQLGYRILEAPTGVKALEVWKQNSGEIRLLLTDLVMPDKMTGKDLAQRILQENPGLKVIYMSGYSAEVVGKDFPLKEGVNFLTKPFQASKLAQTIRDSLDD
jgi:PAS domain S-box-containing protein